MGGEYTHGRLATTAPARAPAPATSPSAGAAGLRILSGPQAGIETTLAPGRFRIGRDPSNDIVLADPSVAPVHALLVVDAAGARLQPLAPGQALSPRRIAPGATAEIRLGETQLSIAAPATTAAERTRWPGLTVLGGAAALLLGVAGAALAAVALAPTLVPTLAPSLSHRADPARDARLASADPAPPPTDAAMPLAHAAQNLADRLAAAGLAGSISLTTSGGALLARGTLPPEALSAWRGVQEWYDAAHPSGPVLLREVAAARLADRPRLQVQAVWTGAMPYLIAADGERYGEGAVVDGGWTIERIEASRILLSRAGRTVALGF